MNLPASMGSDLLQSMTVPLGPVDGMGGAGIPNPSAAAILRILGDLADEVRRSIDFYLNQGDNLEISQLFLAGPGAGLGQIDEFFTQRLSFTTTQIDPIQLLALQVPQEISPEQRPGLGVVMGLGLREV
jgi:type IV pilus assembly protein PilM